jgi:hypothetical protein
MLPSIHILDPNWLTKGIYTVLEQGELIRQHGEFSRNQLKDWLPADKYPPKFFDFILSMMQDKEIELCFPIETRGKDRFLVPEALPVEGHDLSGLFSEDTCLRFSYHYDLLPRSLMPRFIVKTHAHSRKPPARWRTGVMLSVDNCFVHVEADPEKKKVLLKVSGPANSRRAALGFARNALQEVHDINPRINPQPFVPLPDNPAVEESYEYLLELERDDGSDYTYRPRGAVRKYTVEELLDGVRANDSHMTASTTIFFNLDQRHADQRKGTFMGDTFSGIHNSTIINRSLLQNAFNKAMSETGEETAQALRKVAEVVAESGNKEAGEILDQFNEELARAEPRKSLLKRSWESLVQALPTIEKLAGAAEAIAKLFV